MKTVSCSRLAIRLLAWLFTAGVASTSFAASESRVTVDREDGSRFEALLFTPAPGGAPHPVVVFAHGFLSPPELYRPTCQFLAGLGYLVIAPRSALELFPSHAAYARDLSRCLDWAEAQNAEPASPLFGRVRKGSYGLTGHSMGGGASLLAAADDPRFVAVAPMAAAETRPSAIEASGRIKAPLLFITGNQDTFVPNPFHTRPMFEQTAAPSVWIDIRGAYHCGFIRYPLPDAVCDDGTLSSAQQLDIVHPLLASFFDLSFRGTRPAWDVIWGPTSDFDRSLTVRRKNVAGVTPESTRLTAPQGSSGSFVVQVANLDTKPRRFNLATWIGEGVASPLPVQTPVLQPGESVPVTVSFSVPVGATLRRNAVLVRALADDGLAQGGDYGWALLRVPR